MRSLNGLLVSLAALVLTGCEGMGTAAQSKTVQGGVLGSALGAGTGAVIGHQTGRAGEGGSDRGGYRRSRRRADGQCHARARAPAHPAAVCGEHRDEVLPDRG